ncbi:MAG: hypothetical protein ACI4GY_06175 [Acutalibacteraceae bacterium]
MIKGVNRQVVEVVDTGCDYFEKIMFFVKPEYISISESKIRESAGRIASGAGAPPPTKIQHGRFFEVSKAVLFALCGAAAMLLVMNFLK